MGDDQCMELPGDCHVHSEWSWDTGGPGSSAAGRMRQTCAQAERIGLPMVVFTEHLDLPGSWRAEPCDMMDHQQGFLIETGIVDFEPFDVAGYFDDIAGMRAQFPAIEILTGAEVGQPHLHEHEFAAIVDLTEMDLVLGSLHTVQMAGMRAEPRTLYREFSPDVVLSCYLQQLDEMVESSSLFETLAHVDYAVRSWPADTAGPFDPYAFEDEFRTVFQTLAQSDRTLELNTRRLWPWIPRWWAEEGGKRVRFGSDAHTPHDLAAHFYEAVDMAEHFGFHPGTTPGDAWHKR